MPAKRRIQKRRIGDDAEAKAWEMVFRSGHDYFRDLRHFGIEGADSIRDAAPAAWRRYGAAFLASIPPDTTALWGLREFGFPPGTDPAARRIWAMVLQRDETDAD